MSKLSTIRAMVFEKLSTHPDTRDDDFILIMNIYNNHFDTNYLSFVDVMKNHNKYGLPSFESIRRTRQFVQARYPDLRASAQVEEGRCQKQDDYIRFAIEGR